MVLLLPSKDPDLLYGNVCFILPSKDPDLLYRNIVLRSSGRSHSRAATPAQQLYHLQHSDTSVLQKASNTLTLPFCSAVIALRLSILQNIRVPTNWYLHRVRARPPAFPQFPSRLQPVVAVRLPPSPPRLPSAVAFSNMGTAFSIGAMTAHARSITAFSTEPVVVFSTEAASSAPPMSST